MKGFGFEKRGEKSGVIGYRSMLDTVKAVPLDGLIFFQTPVAELTVREVTERDGYDSFEGYALVDDVEYMWLCFGMNNYDDYYLSFCFRYDPPKSAPTPSVSRPDE